MSSPEGAIFMHCFSAHRGEEVAARSSTHQRSVIYDEAENRLHVQKAIMYKLMKRLTRRSCLTLQTRHTRGRTVVIILGVIFFALLALLILRSGSRRSGATFVGTLSFLSLRLRLRTQRPANLRSSRRPAMAKS